MKKVVNKKIPSGNYLKCFGDFNLEDDICKKFCALNLRCAIMKNVNSNLEIFEDLMSGEFANITTQ